MGVVLFHVNLICSTAPNPVTPRLTRGPLGLAERFFVLKSFGYLEWTPRQARGDGTLSLSPKLD